jgi:hypothetical protein
VLPTWISFLEGDVDLISWAYTSKSVDDNEKIIKIKIKIKINLTATDSLALSVESFEFSLTARAWEK